MTASAPPRPTGRTTTTIRISREMYARLWRERQPYERFEDVIRRLLALRDLQDAQPTERA